MSENLNQVLELLQSVAGEAADDLYVIEKGTYNLLYVNQLKRGACKEAWGKKSVTSFCMGSPNHARSVF